jgi:glycosyltransferase involved in cell wall biosynthesis
VFADHSSEHGGAEFALIRLLQTDQPWSPAVVLPPATEGTDVFTETLGDRVPIEHTGPRHVARRQGGTGAVAAARLALKIVASGVSLARTRTVRKADVLVANTTRSSVYVAVAGALTRTPFVVHIRDLVTPDAIGGTATQLMRRFVLPRAGGIIANSHASLATVRSYVRTNVVEVIPSPSGLHPVDAAEVSVAAKVSRIGLVARIDPWKGQELLLRAFAAACSDSDVSLVFFGGPSFGHEAFLEELATLAQSLGVADRVEFAGHRSDVDAAIDSLDICIQCSLRPEPLGQNVLQYLAAGKPTIVSGEGGPDEWVTHGKNGLVFTPRDAGALASAIRTAIDDLPLRRRIAAGAAATPELLSDQQVGERIFDVAERSVSA